ncbi:MAG: PEP-CTERM sorting domain-containing protein [Verrucomicrobiota bacterium]
MKKSLILVTAAFASMQTLSAGLLQLDNITGMFTDGPLTGTSIEGFIEVEDNGLITGTADTTPLTMGDGVIVDLGFEFSTPDLVFFDLFDDLDPFITFSNGQITGIDYFGSNLDGEFLDVTYDAFQPDLASGIAIQFEDALGNVSTGVLDLPVNVPEPSTYALIAGVSALVVLRMRRRAKA